MFANPSGSQRTSANLSETSRTQTFRTLANQKEPQRTSSANFSEPKRTCANLAELHRTSANLSPLLRAPPRGPHLSHMSDLNFCPTQKPYFKNQSQLAKIELAQVELGLNLVPAQVRFVMDHMVEHFLAELLGQLVEVLQMCPTKRMWADSAFVGANQKNTTWVRPPRHTTRVQRSLFWELFEGKIAKTEKTRICVQ